MFDIADGSYEDIRHTTYDLLVCCAGFESRGRYFAKQLVKRHIALPARRIVLGFVDFADHPERLRNDEFFARQSFEALECDDRTYGSVVRLLNAETKGREGVFRVLVDYSCMRRTMYSEILQFANAAKSRLQLVIDFVYSVGARHATLRPRVVTDYTLLTGFEGKTRGQREKAAIYNLGFEPIIVQSIHDWLEPAESVAFYADPGVNRGSGKKCREVNRRFIDQAGSKLVPISLFSVTDYARAFMEAAKTLLLKHDLMVFSAGPKPFILGSLLSASERLQPSFVYASGSETEPVDTPPAGITLITRVAQVLEFPPKASDTLKEIA